MGPQPRPAIVMHFTRVEHLPDIFRVGLVCDTEAHASGLLQLEVGNTGIKAQRRRRVVPLPPGGTVADYVPFYFAPRSPMMYSIECGNVPTYTEGCDRIVYLVTSLESLVAHGLDPIVTDRNAALNFAEYARYVDGLEDGFIDWDLMGQRMWNSTIEFPDRMERRMAECLVHSCVPWDTFAGIATKSAKVADEVEYMMARAGVDKPVLVRREWYF